ncbi:serine/threonine-protein kinase [Clostridium thermarum]|uniref:serine/threonine-protein kinase n=1 Tax=Clostridium thermarum TaxID=1716543 RepID=UPI0013D722EF|nr:serine/threonine-protein kinase [Clostridium thermarum]
MLNIGDIIDNKYEIVQVIGQGGMGRVYKAQHIVLKNLWAIKEMRLVNGSLSDLLVEPDILRRLKHPSLPGIIDIFRIHNYIYIVEDYIEGVSLDKLLRERGPFEEETVISWAKEVCGVFQYLHSHRPPIIYRDMKPENIMIDKQGKVKVIDFGIAKEYSSEKEVKSYGTPGYASPEQYRGYIDEKTDIYNLGATMYALLTGKPPRDKRNLPETSIVKPMDLNINVTPAMEKIIMKCLRDNPSLRYNNIMEMLQDLNNIEKINKRITHRNLRAVVKYTVIGAIFITLLGTANVVYKGLKERNFNRYNSNVSAALEKYKNGEVLVAEKELVGLTIEKPEYPEAYRELYKIYIRQNQSDKAVSNYEQYGEKIKADKELFYVIGRAYAEVGDYTSAEDYLKMALEEDENYKEAKEALCVVYVKKKDFSSAERLVGELEREDEADSYVSYLKAEILRGKGSLKEAEKSIESAMAIDPSNKRYVLFYAELLEQQGDGGKALSILEEAERKFSGDLEILYKTGEMYQRLAWNEENEDFARKSNEIFEEYIMATSPNKEIYLKMGMNFRILKEYTKAFEYFEKAIATDKSYASAYFQMGYLAIVTENEKSTERKDYSRAKEYLQMGISLKPDSEESKQAEDYLRRIRESEKR